MKLQYSGEEEDTSSDGLRAYGELWEMCEAPSVVHDWKYWDEDQWKPGNITVTCKNGEEERLGKNV